MIMGGRVCRDQGSNINFQINCLQLLEHLILFIWIGRQALEFKSSGDKIPMNFTVVFKAIPMDFFIQHKDDQPTSIFPKRNWLVRATVTLLFICSSFKREDGQPGCSIYSFQKHNPEKQH